MHMRNALVNIPIAFIFGLCIIGRMITPADIKRHRKRLDETQTEFARRFNVNQSTVARWERGDLAIEGIAAVAVEYVLAELSRQAARRVA
jgi:predicted transcriptional regulator